MRRPPLALVALLSGGCAILRPVARSSMTPRVTYAEEEPPAAPDYADDGSWSALPDRDDAGDPLPDGVEGVDQRRAPADVFYVHPTSYVGKRWNGPVDDPKVNADTDRVATGIQAPAFNGCCAVYAPRYRQANGTAFIDVRPDGERAVDLAWEDVRRAFEAFQARRGPDRPFVLAGHSQGSVLAERLLYEVIAPGPLREQLVVAVLPGGSVTTEGLREHGLEPCATPDDLECVVAWNARGPRYRPHGFDLQRPDTREHLCVNPLTWRDDGEPATTDANLGAVFLEDEDRSVRPGFADGQCIDGTLVVTHLEHAPRDLPSRILDGVLGPQNYHPIEVQMVFMNLRENVDHRVDLYLHR
ncbi:MAG: DUF3089 domain-containing protein [Alphaproteobacteria bacterium]|nr:DUF3089 domain-containing protein [Alphaproteobacteria bacterium]